MIAPMHILLCALLALMAGCVSKLPEESPPLADMEEPLELFAEPDDEAARTALPLGTFTGVSLGAASGSLDQLFEAASGLPVQDVAANSPADVAGIVSGDLLLEARLGEGEWTPLRADSDWRRFELEATDITPLEVRFDRAGRITRTTIRPIPRVRAAARVATRRVREEQRIGVVLRSATEVESRAAGLGPGAGVVIVGLSANSPWRAAGLRFGDLITQLGSTPIGAPEHALDALRTASGRIAVTYRRDGTLRTIDTPLTTRARHVREFSIPLLVDYESARGKSDFSLLFGFFRHEQTKAAWRIRFLWFLRFGRGDENALLEVDK